ncbi:MAG: hypothetical protein KDC79_04220 [Cyclobacteriaceae bacterium]|nr:hypothetical protein [Cyclobacteriaceae bacterium]
MYETLFDINHLSDWGILFNLIFFPLELIVLGFMGVIGWKVKSFNRILTGGLFTIILVVVYVNFAFYLRKHEYIRKFNQEEYSISQGKIDSIVKKGKSTLFSVDGYKFRVSGSGLITPFFNEPGLIHKLYDSASEIRVVHVNGNILKLDKKL